MILKVKEMTQEAKDDTKNDENDTETIDYRAFAPSGRAFRKIICHRPRAPFLRHLPWAMSLHPFQGFACI